LRRDYEELDLMIEAPVKSIHLDGGDGTSDITEQLK